MSQQLIEKRQLIDDPWRVVGDDEAIGVDERVLVSWARWLAEGEALQSLPPGHLGVVVNAAKVAPDALGRAAQHFAVIAFDFPAFADGRAFSHAAMLRGRYRYQGQIRAMGQILPDQLQFLERCGFDAFLLPEAHPAEEALRFFTEFSAAYQPAQDGERPVFERRGIRTS